MTVDVVVVGKPIPKGSLNRGRNGRGLFFPKRVVEWENAIKVEALREMKRSGYPLIGGRCSVNLRFYLQPTIGGKAPGRLMGDIDKLVRTVLDAFTGAIYEDDELVVGLSAQKLPVEKNGLVRVEASVTAWKATPDDPPPSESLKESLASPRVRSALYLKRQQRQTHGS